MPDNCECYEIPEEHKSYFLLHFKCTILKSLVDATDITDPRTIEKEHTTIDYISHLLRLHKMHFGIIAIPPQQFAALGCEHGLRDVLETEYEFACIARDTMKFSHSRREYETVMDIMKAIKADYEQRCNRRRQA